MVKSQAELLTGFSRYWWVVGLRGIISIIFGIGAFVWPSITLLVLVLFFGAYMFVDGIFALVAAVRSRNEGDHWPMLLLEGILGVAVGVVTFFWPGITALAWLYIIAAWAIITGVLEIIAAIRLRKVIQGEVFLALLGVVSIAAGVLLALMPAAGLVAWVWVIGAYAIFFGVLLAGLAFRLRGPAAARA